MKELPPLPLFLLLAVSGGDSHEVDSQLICSHEPVVALAGEDVILPCRLEPPMGPGAGRVLWSKPGLDRKFILVYHQGRMIREEQNPAYEKRTFLFEDQLKDGNVSLKLSGVKVSDAGRYLCTHEAAVRSSYIQLTVAAVSSVFINRLSMKSEEAVLECESSGWFPEPEMMFLDQDGIQVPAAPTETVQGPDGLYSVRRTAVVDDTTNFTCRVHLEDFNQTREAAIFVPADVLHGLITIAVIYSLFNSIFFLFVFICNFKDKKGQKAVYGMKPNAFLYFFGLKLVNFCAVLGLFAELMNSIDEFEDTLFFYSLLSCVSVVAFADLLSSVVILMKKYGVSFQRQLSFSLIVMNVVLVGAFVTVHVTVVWTSENFLAERIPSFWNVNTVVFLSVVYFMIAGVCYSERTKLTALKKIFTTQKDPHVAKSELRALTATGQQEEEEEKSEEDASAGDEDAEIASKS
ncbi:uncharacterized protein V6R79_019160 [Siganus canaliculatus]